MTFSPASEAPNNAPVEPEILLLLELALMELGHRCNATHNSLSLSKPILVLLLLTETQRSKAPQPPPMYPLTPLPCYKKHSYTVRLTDADNIPIHIDVASTALHVLDLRRSQNHSDVNVLPAYHAEILPCKILPRV